MRTLHETCTLLVFIFWWNDSCKGWVEVVLVWNLYWSLTTVYRWRGRMITPWVGCCFGEIGEFVIPIQCHFCNSFDPRKFSTWKIVCTTTALSFFHAMYSVGVCVGCPNSPNNMISQASQYCRRMKSVAWPNLCIGVKNSSGFSFSERPVCLGIGSCLHSAIFTEFYLA